jgi:NADPH2:quinone reductase
MRAMVAKEFGGPQVLQWADVPEPIVGAQDLLIDVHAAAVNPVDCKMRSGMISRRQPPLLLGFDVSGVVLAMGAAVEGFAVGDEVYASPSLARDGANGERVAVDYRTAARKPRSLDHLTAAAIPLVAITAWESLHQRAQLHHAHTVLIHGGAGGVGHLAIQLAKLDGCRVITTAGRDESIAYCKELGADVVINYRDENVVQRVMDETAGRGCPVVLDPFGGQTLHQSLQCVSPLGDVVTLAPVPPDAPVAELFAKSASLHQELMSATIVYGVRPHAQGEILRTVCELVEAEKLTPRVSHTFTLDELAKAHEQQETRHTLGKIAIRVKD